MQPAPDVAAIVSATATASPPSSAFSPSQPAAASSSTATPFPLPAYAGGGAPATPAPTTSTAAVPSTASPLAPLAADFDPMVEFHKPRFEFGKIPENEPPLEVR